MKKINLINEKTNELYATIEIEDILYNKCKMVAKKEKKTIEQIILEALRQEIETEYVHIVGEVS